MVRSLADSGRYCAPPGATVHRLLLPPRVLLSDGGCQGMGAVVTNFRAYSSRSRAAARQRGRARNAEVAGSREVVVDGPADSPEAVRSREVGTNGAVFRIQLCNAQHVFTSCSVVSTASGIGRSKIRKRATRRPNAFSTTRRARDKR